MKTICFYFQVHQPLRLKKYRFFNMARTISTWTTTRTGRSCRKWPVGAICR